MLKISDLVIGNHYSNADIVEAFKCGNMGGMRRAKKTGCLVIISDRTKAFYKDEWIDGVLHYTGMGKIKDQVLRGNQNITLYESNTNGVEVHLFEVEHATKYIYRGIVKLVGTPYQKDQINSEGASRKVWIFPVKPVIDIVVDEDPDPADVVAMPVKQLLLSSKSIEGKKHEPKVSEITVFHRNPYLKEAVKRVAEGKCQFCGKDAPFVDNYGQPYLEEHHVKKLADGGTDTSDNVVAICPNCHRRIHVLNSKEDELILEKIASDNADRIKRLLEYTNLQK